METAAMIATLGTPLRDLILIAAGFGAGFFNAIAGGGTFITFPTMLALGIPALSANVTSTVGIMGGYLGGVAGFSQEIADQMTTLRRLLVVSLVGASIGSILLITTNPALFRSLVPWLVAVGTVLFGVQPLLVRWLSARPRGHVHHEVALQVGVLLASIYGGYFGAGLGIMLLAVLGLTLPDSFARSAAVRSALSLVINALAAVIFVVSGHVVWGVVWCLFLGSALGGISGAHTTRRLPSWMMRAVVVTIGVITVVLTAA